MSKTSLRPGQAEIESNIKSRVLFTANYWRDWSQVKIKFLWKCDQVKTCWKPSNPLWGQLVGLIHTLHKQCFLEEEITTCQTCVFEKKREHKHYLRKVKVNTENLLRPDSSPRSDSYNSYKTGRTKKIKVTKKIENMPKLLLLHLNLGLRHLNLRHPQQQDESYLMIACGSS